MAGITDATFAVMGDEGAYRVVIRSYCGENPVGPRLLRNGFMPERFLRPTYATKDEALESRSAWEAYCREHINKEKPARKAG